MQYLLQDVAEKRKKSFFVCVKIWIQLLLSILHSSVFSSVVHTRLHTTRCPWCYCIFSCRWQYVRNLQEQESTMFAGGSICHDMFSCTCFLFLCSPIQFSICCLSSKLGTTISMVSGCRLKGSVWSLLRKASTEINYSKSKITSHSSACNNV